ncbi:unnamed protein product [Protopolystoma xenopodis]|uniref:Slingshot N-terminal domain-containing protein n=1 Tax=Protopolystoma xenopodis TaxID=117903 RepID=A0A3S5BZH3_9PLAT|nr:unnamed protein product [Protopolystoma xenopodis]
MQSSFTKPYCYRYLCIVSTNGRQETEESAIIGLDIKDGKVSIGLVLPIWQDMVIHLGGDGGFRVVTKEVEKLFKPISVQALWAAFQAVNKSCQIARENSYFAKGLNHSWIGYYISLPSSDHFQMQDWQQLDEADSLNKQPDPPIYLTDDATEEE